MTEKESLDTQPEGLGEAVVVPRSRFSLVWLVPIVALLIGGWLAYKAHSERGPTVRIQFKTAEGLEAGKTKVKFKDVDVGKVTEIDVSEDLDSVVVVAELVAGAERYLTTETRFWVARARVTPSQVTGLDTLLSGAYIAVDPVAEGESARSFVGLEVPPIFTTSEPGKRFVLHSETLGSLNVGSPVFYRRIQVGQVVGYNLADDGKAVDIELFIAAPNDRLVRMNSRFWNASGVDSKLSTDGLSVATESLLSVLVGGIAFDTPPSAEGAEQPAPNDKAFPLYANRDNARERIYQGKKRFLLYFDGSVRGLDAEAPVMVRGIKVGRVLSVELQFDVKEFKFNVPVLIEVEPDRVRFVGGNLEDLEKHSPLERFVAQGMRAQLRPASLITGQLYVDLDFYDDLPPAEIKKKNGYSVFPTVSGSPLDSIANKADEFLDSLNALPLEQIGRDLSEAAKRAKDIAGSEGLVSAMQELEATLKQLREASRSLNRDLMPKLSATLTQTHEVLGSVAPDSQLHRELMRMIEELSAAARSVGDIADYLERHPEALIRGKGRN